MFDNDAALCFFTDFCRMRDSENRMPFVVKFMKNLHDKVLILLVEVARRFVGKDENRIIDEGTGNADTLLLAARQLAWQMLGSSA